MSQLSDDEVMDILRSRMPARQSASPRELWPRMRDRIHERPMAAMPFDWLLAIAAVLLCLLQPAVVSILLLHF